ncbi:MAG: SDR family NAD(P)-dependent oxidoreductase [Oscillospiraceae bacterium]|nr:SDR family NAD(P)-dependent oxidoreductase [Oscillospiraceae bacterium]
MLDKLVELSNKYGADPNFVLAGGGNTSYKSGGLIYVKASGTALGSITAEGFVALERAALEAMRAKTYPGNEAEREAAVLTDLMEARVRGAERRPSVETLLHDLFPQAYVLHLHPALVNGITCAAGGEAAADKLFGDDFIWVPSTKPGYILAAECEKLMREYKNKHNKDCRILILQNHGIFWADDDLDRLEDNVSGTMKKIEAALARKPDFSEYEYNKTSPAEFIPKIRMCYAKKTGAKTACAKFLFNREIEHLVRSREDFMPIAKPFTPDHMVYYKDEPLFVENTADFERLFDGFVSEKGYVPKIAAVKNMGCFALGRTKKECETAAALFFDAVKISVYTKSFGGYLPLSPELREFIINWESENYRQGIALGGENTKRLNEKICIVTGAAQGFGKGLAELMVKEGANVVIADLNYEGVKTLADELNKKTGTASAFAVRADVANEESVQNMVQAAALEFGGVDIYVNNAGIVRAGGLDELELRDFNLVTNVNYTAYFLCVKYVSKIMKIQHETAPDMCFDIIEINSKSGLAGSNKNFAYAGSKFGGIGLTQSFALELAPYNIKVNAVCPGNFLDGPLWSDPENGLFVQYLKAGKVPGAKTVADVKKFYESKVPMGRGCQTSDVMRAVLYAVEQVYETGQAIPVTGGQEMLR